VTLVVDASVACKWFLAESGADHAEALLAGGSLLVAPGLIVAEVCNVACLKLRRSEIAADQAVAIVESLPDLLDELVPSAQLAPRAFAIASALSHSAYDCFYLALAEVRGMRLVTADHRLLARLAKTPWVSLVTRLGNGAAEG
jgi:predicted nucleic acid-binding protein